MNSRFTYKGLFDSTLGLAVERLKSPVQTDRAITSVLLLSATGIAGLVLVALPMTADRGLPFLAWSTISALASTLAGGVLGLLFALPASRRSDVRATHGSGAGEPSGSGYEESTSLEQIADWLTKIIVGLTLTQWATWSAAFDRLSATLTHDLLCPTSTAGCGSAPGGVLVAACSLAGFIVAYLWTRRFFILEMVTRDDAIQKVIRAQQQRDEAAKEGRVQAAVTYAAGDAAPDYTDTVRAIIEDAKRNTTGAAKAAAEQLQSGTDPDDPWRGAFGGSSATSEAMMTAIVSAVPAQPRIFEVEVTVAGVTPESQRKLAGQKVLLFLHPTFGKEVKVVSCSAAGQARLELYAYGAFTVGALLEDGTTLELNLALLPGAPDQFKVE